MLRLPFEDSDSKPSPTRTAPVRASFERGATGQIEGTRSSRQNTFQKLLPDLNPINRALMLSQFSSDSQTELQADELLANLPRSVPPGVDIVGNMSAAEQMNVLEFYEAVKNKGSWDYKQLGSEYQEFGNWHFGVVGKAFGVSEEIGQRGAGWAQWMAGTSKPEWGNFLSDYPYGDDPNDQVAMARGFRTHDILKEQTADEIMRGIEAGDRSPRVCEPDSDTDFLFP